MPNFSPWKKHMIGTLFTVFLLSLPLKTDAQTNKIIFLHYWTGALSGGINEMVRTFNQAHPEFTVKATGFEHESFKISIKVMLASGNPPDIFSYWAGARVLSLVKQGYLAPIDDLWKNAGLDKRFPPSVSAACTYQGKKYVIPVTQHYAALFYNKKLFAKLDLKIPKTWPEFISVCNKLKQAGITPISLGSRDKWPGQFWFDYILLRTAGPEFRQKLMSGSVAYTDPEVLNAFKIWKDLIQNNYFNEKPNLYDWSEAAKMVLNGKTAMTLMGTWIIGLWEGQLGWKPGIDFDYFAFPSIDPSVANTAVGPIDGIVLAAEARNLDSAKKILEYFADTIPQMEMSKGSGALAPNQKIAQDFYPEIKRRILKTIQNTPNWAFNYDLATPPEAAEIGLACFSKFLDQPEKYAELLGDTEQKMHQIFAVKSK